ncbi:hypothetical protein GWI33_008816 [Rhynchophorus ferrugineus]|uniref:Uncharacterized protein n=1 Tax=Rhynchophorus ferrugineus TaxID=354439 RepID=A0A834IE51_RHYFE|nr:hypothetical protein GWI33_008816 [Rhynchophorus ferrugineus]
MTTMLLITFSCPKNHCMTRNTTEDIFVAGGTFRRTLTGCRASQDPAELREEEKLIKPKKIKINKRPDEDPYPLVFDK